LVNIATYLLGVIAKIVNPKSTFWKQRIKE